MNSMLRTESDLKVKSKLKLQGNDDYLCVSFSPNTHHIDELVGMFVYWPDKYPIIKVEAMARWESFFPSYEVYIGAIEDLFSLRLKAYNKLYKRRYRLRIPNSESCIPRLTPMLKEKFDNFAILANKNCLHPYDWKRFYEFVVASYRSQRNLNQDEVRYHLRTAGFNDRQCDHLAEAFYRCKDFYIETNWRRRNSYYKQ